MYCKLFASLYQGTLRGRSHEILVFTNLMAHATKDGYVDKHFRAIAEETGLTIDEVKAAIVTLESPDEESRSPAANGARLRRMDEHRVWGWEIVNYAKYRAIRNEEDRAEQNRLAQARWREKHKQSKPPSAESKPDKPMQRQEAEGEAKADEEGRSPVVTAPPIPPSPPVILKRPKRAIAMAEGEWIAHLENDPTYRGIDVRRELGKMQQWCLLKKKPASQQRFLSWLNRIDKPILGTSQISAPLSDEQREISTWFGRQPDDWTAEERQMWDALPMLTKEDMDALRWFYTKSGYGYLRKSLPSLLKNLRAEIDTAKNYTPETK